MIHLGRNKMKHRRRSVLIAEPDRAKAHEFREHLEEAGYLVFLAYDFEQAAILTARQRHELIVTNFDLPNGGATEFCRHVREDLRLVEIPVIVCATHEHDAELESLRYRFSIARVLYAPVDPSQMVNVANEVVSYLVSTH